MNISGDSLEALNICVVNVRLEIWIISPILLLDQCQGTILLVQSNTRVTRSIVPELPHVFVKAILSRRFPMHVIHSCRIQSRHLLSHLVIFSVCILFLMVVLELDHVLARVQMSLHVIGVIFQLVRRSQNWILLKHLLMCLDKRVLHTSLLFLANLELKHFSELVSSLGIV